MIKTIVKIIVGILCAYLLLIIIGNIWTQVWLRMDKNNPMPEAQKLSLGLTGELKVKDRIWLTGGYDYNPKWLNGNKGFWGTVDSFIIGQNKTSAAVIKLDNKISVENITGDIVVLELRWEGARWGNEGVVHVELCDFMPENKSWKERKQGKWIESHASYKKY